MSGRWRYVVISFRIAKEEQSEETQASPTCEVLVEEGEWKKED